ncbi:hypothetical protein [Crassaminicella indica]|uniref:Uncharacterized protein n=1 Tax=Crassaminicella indica TaxID=2855394 RepID=A0ABX8RBW6_9CLOT|nr:hypothetical protein [Crassaminicella indica]QXM05797.1 hypothetical protein KVH43_10585 [Crassaminicella indica]
MTLISEEQGTKKHTDFTSGQIKEYLSKLRKLVIEGKYSISQNKNRMENISFIEEYKINSDKEREILLSIEYDDFCYAVDNQNPKFAHEILYVFNKEYELDNWGELESVDIYIKTNMTQTRRGDDIIIVVSFHKRNKPISYLFR